MDFPLYTTISCFLFRWLHIFVTKETVISPLFSHFSQDIGFIQHLGGEGQGLGREHTED